MRQRTSITGYIGRLIGRVTHSIDSALFSIQYYLWPSPDCFRAPSTPEMIGKTSPGILPLFFTPNFARYFSHLIDIALCNGSAICSKNILPKNKEAKKIGKIKNYITRCFIWDQSRSNGSKVFRNDSYLKMASFSKIP